MSLLFNKVSQLTSEHYELLLEADPSKDLVDSYFKRSLTFEALKENKLVGIIVLLETRPETIEIVNISVHPDYQNQGIAQSMLRFTIEYAEQQQLIAIEIGTGSTSLAQLYLYQKMNFRIVGVDRDFFTHHYAEEIIENGLVLKDMIRLQLILDK